MCVERTRGFIWAQKCNNSLCGTHKHRKLKTAEGREQLPSDIERVTLAVIAGHLDCAEHGQVV